MSFLPLLCRATPFCLQMSEFRGRRAGTGLRQGRRVRRQDPSGTGVPEQSRAGLWVSVGPGREPRLPRSLSARPDGFGPCAEGALSDGYFPVCRTFCLLALTSGGHEQLLETLSVPGCPALSSVLPVPTRVRSLSRLAFVTSPGCSVRGPLKGACLSPVCSRLFSVLFAGHSGDSHGHLYRSLSRLQTRLHLAA